MKNVLVIYYSQSGQLSEIISRFIKSFTGDVSVDVLRIQPENDYKFPWSGKRFFSVMPDSVLGNPTEIKDFDLKEESYDLVVIGYQPWFLSPSIPVNSILHHPRIVKVLKNTPVVTVIGARNMWLNSQEKIRKRLNELNAPVVGNIALVDRNHNLASVVSILYWMLTGKKEKYLGIFPRPGVSEEDISRSENFGRIVLKHLRNSSLPELQQELVKNKAVVVDRNLMFIESRAGKLFNIWANFIAKRKNKVFWLNVFKYYLIVALFIVAPVVLLVNTILFRPFQLGRIKRKRKYYLGLN